MEEHFAERIKVQGRTQTYFQFCEASKGITDLYVGHAVPYLPFEGYSSTPPAKLCFDRDVNSAGLIHTKWLEILSRFSVKHGELYRRLVAFLPVQRSIETGSM